MLRSISRRAPSAFLKIQARRTHSAKPPFSGPPSYKTLFERFSPSNPSPLRWFAEKKEEEYESRSIFVDIHDIGKDPKAYDVLITDIDNKVLENEISDIAGIQYLKEATNGTADEVLTSIPGFLYGKYRMILPCALKIKGKARWVFFVVDSGAPLTYISPQVAQAFKLHRDEDPWMGSIAGYQNEVYMSPKKSHFSNINLLGGDFCHFNRLRPWVHDKGRVVTYYLGTGWDVVQKQRVME